MTKHVDASLVHWEEVWEGDIKPSGRGKASIILGNGASRAIWSDFEYPSLYDLACDSSRPVYLTDSDQQIFQEMDTTNFEGVLSALTTARIVNEILGQRTDLIWDHYERIRNSLIHAIRNVHIPYRHVSEDIKCRVTECLATYQNVFSTNYDLLVYWSCATNMNRFKDYMWSRDNVFNVGDCEVWGDYATRVYYLHGALHIYRTPTGTTYKKVGSLVDGGLIDQFTTDERDIPLFISEGRWQNKKSAILRNDYLSFCYRKLVETKGHLVVFGHALNEDFDKHILQAIHQRRETGYHGVVAIGVYPHMGEANIAHEKARLNRALQGSELRFFDSTTHPLGDPSLLVSVTT